MCTGWFGYFLRGGMGPTPLDHHLTIEHSSAMKKIILSAALLAQFGFAVAQVPQSLNYQALARNAANQIQANKTMKVRLTIKVGAAMGTSQYSETRSITTNANGLFNVVIGSAGALSTTGSFASIDWLNGSHWLMTELDVNNNGTFVDLGTVQMQSTPYAMAAGTASSLKLPFSATGNQPGDMLNILNNSGSAISGDGRGMSSVGVKGATDLNIGVMGVSYGSGTAIYGQSTSGLSGRFVTPATNTKSVVEIEHKGAANGLKVTSAGGQAIQANSTGQGVGVSATTDNNIGILATSNNTGTAIYGTSYRGTAANFVTQAGNSNITVKSQSLGNGIAVQGLSDGGFGLQGVSKTNIGVRGSSTSGAGVLAASETGNGLTASSASGVGVSSTTTTGTAAKFSAPVGAKALEVAGSIKLTSTTNPHGLGKVLTSDENGFATWQGAVAFKTTGVFDDNLPNSINTFQIVNSAMDPKKVNFKTVNMNFGNAYANGVFTAPVNGIYHFNTGVLWDEQLLVLPGEFVRIDIIRQGISGGPEVLASVTRNNLDDSESMQLTVDAYIFEGDKVSVRATAFSPDFVPKKIHNNDGKNGTWFSGHMITRM